MGQIKIVDLDPKTFTEEVTYEIYCGRVGRIGQGSLNDGEDISDSGFALYDVADAGDPPTDLAGTMLDTASYDPTRKVITAKINASTGTRGHTYWLIGAADTTSVNTYIFIGRFKIEDGVGPLNAT